MKPGSGVGVQKGAYVKPRRLLRGDSPLGGQPERSILKRFSLDRNTMRKLDKVKILKPIGRRGRRLQPGDRKQEAITHKMRCYCGCMDHRDPEPGEVARAHFESRAYEKTRNADANNIPACYALSHWLDHERAGVKCKADLLVLAKEKQDRLTPEEVRPLLKLHAYYDWRIGAFRA